MLFQTFCRWLVFSGQTDRTTLCTESLPSHLGKTQTRWRALRGLYNTRKKGSQLTVSHLLLIFQAVGRQQHGGDQIPAGCEINSIETILVPVGTVISRRFYPPLVECNVDCSVPVAPNVWSSINHHLRGRGTMWYSQLWMAFSPLVPMYKKSMILRGHV